MMNQLMNPNHHNMSSY
uniref:Uncharacterized protein n=1 Tax=Rhizophora mucronata TaxID=61149 RepID=A0A2P2PVP7_RHIMU